MLTRSANVLQLETVEWSTAGEILEKIRQLGHMLTKAHAHELAIGNVVRRVLYIIREEHSNALKLSSADGGAAAQVPAPPSSRNNNLSRSLGTILTPARTRTCPSPSPTSSWCVQRPAPMKTWNYLVLTLLLPLLFQSVMEGIAELVDEIDSLHVNIADQAMEYIHSEYVAVGLVRSKYYFDADAGALLQ